MTTADPPRYTPKIALVAYTETTDDGQLSGMVFVAVPNERGRYVKTDLSVVQVSCPKCESVPGEPCKSTNTGDGYTAATHHSRKVSWGAVGRACAAGLRFTLEPSPPVVEDPDSAPLVRAKYRRCPVCERPVLSARGSGGVVRYHLAPGGAGQCDGTGSTWFRLPVCPAPVGASTKE